MKSIVFAIFAAVLAGCTSVNVQSVKDETLFDLVSLHEVCIVRNSKVLVSDFISVLQDGFDRHNIATRVVEPTQVKSCEVTLTYTALRSWDVTPYLSHAELRLRRGGKLIGSADYHLKGGGGLALTKYGSTKEKMDPVIDQLLTGKAGN